uniref:Enoyl-CoA hydratase/isomerase (Crt) n=1 Tax=uncultured marine group II/III euryarchaeote KM3_109_G01 TaxID=1457850 RepID=A0A075GBH8_9EURY|nr:enoyl-CoA hydratase/isomerase (crt) [uncultured marine group II/III euryarchaeote KM3_109_G01]
MTERDGSTEVLSIESIALESSSPEGGKISLWTIDRPQKLNALNREVYAALKQTCELAEADAAVRVIVIRGAPPAEPVEGERAKPSAFVAGADITEFVGQSSEDIRPHFEQNAWEAIWNLSKPTIAMIDGFALGGGTEIALSCDIRIASDRSRFGTPEINLGLIPGGGGTQRLTRLLGYGKAAEMVLSGEMISASEAHRIGLINHIYSAEELKSKTLKLAQQIGSKSAHTLKAAKQVLRSALDTSLTEGISTEREVFCSLFDSADKEIGVQAFLNRESPLWKGE